MTTTSSALADDDLGALLAQHPVGCWMAGAVAFALLGIAALTGLRSLRQHVGAPLGRVFPPQARWVLVAAMVNGSEIKERQEARYLGFLGCCGL